MKRFCTLIFAISVAFTTPVFAQSGGSGGSSGGSNSSSFNGSGSSSSSSSQNGDTTTTIDQGFTVKSGNAQSGSQIHGVNDGSSSSGAAAADGTSATDGNTNTLSTANPSATPKATTVTKQLNDTQKSKSDGSTDQAIMWTLVAAIAAIVVGQPALKKLRAKKNS